MNTSYRINKFRSFKTDAWWGRKFAKLRAGDVAFCEAWITEHDQLDQGQFDVAVVRLGMDQPELRAAHGKRWANMDELIANTNAGHAEATGIPNSLAREA